MQGPEVLWHLCSVSQYDAGEVYVFPTERRDVFEQFVGNILTLLPYLGRGAAEISGVPMDDGAADHKVEAGSPESLAVKGLILYFAALMEEEGALGA